MNDQHFEQKHQRLMDAQRAFPTALWPEAQLRQLERSAVRFAAVEQDINALFAGGSRPSQTAVLRVVEEAEDFEMAEFDAAPAFPRDFEVHLGGERG